MSYKTEMHCHTSPVSSCASVTPERVVEEYLKAGYSTIVLTNHFSFFSFEPHRLGKGAEATWADKVEYYISAYRDLCRCAEGKLNIILGAELRSNTDGNDYLMYGIDENFLLDNSDIMDIGVEEVSKRLHEIGALFVQAHPFRNGMRVKNPTCFDGVEVYNGHVWHESRNELAYMWAEKYGKIMTSGSDYHEVAHVIDAGIETDEPITNAKQLVEVLKKGKYSLIRTGAAPY